jgi:hypothetical protein
MMSGLETALAFMVLFGLLLRPLASGNDAA